MRKREDQANLTVVVAAAAANVVAAWPPLPLLAVIYATRGAGGWRRKEVFVRGRSEGKGNLWSWKLEDVGIAVDSWRKK